jgi:hypothetical protein
MLARMRAAAFIGLLLLSGTFPGYSQAGSPATGFSVPAMIDELAILFPQPAGQQGQARPNGPRELLDTPRDPGLFFSLAQVNALLPLLQALWQNPFPTPPAAKKLQSTVDGLLTPAQRSALEKYRRSRGELMAQAGQRGTAGAGSAMPGSAGGGPTPLLRRRVLIEGLIGMLQQRKKELTP